MKRQNSLPISVQLQAGIDLLRDGHNEAAAPYLHDVIKRQPRNLEALKALGVLYIHANRPAEAVDHLTRASVLAPSDLSILNLLAIALQLSGNTKEALNLFRKIARLSPGNPEHHYNLAKALRASDLIEDAIVSYRKAIALKPDYVEALNNISALYNIVNSPDQALIHTNDALRIAPGFPEALSNQSLAFFKLGKVDEAQTSANAALQKNPNLSGANITKACIALAENRFQKALDHFGIAHKSDPNDAHTAWHLAFTNLVMGKFQDGFYLFNKRWDSVLKGVHPNFPKPAWNGLPSDKKILLWGEQGLGDQILYCSLVPEISQRVRNLQIACAPRLVPVLSRSFPNVKVISPEIAANTLDFDAYLCLGDTLHLLRTSVNDFIANRKAYLTADEERGAVIKEKLSALNRPIVGISWFSKTTDFGDAKSMSLLALATAISVTGATLINLQYGETTLATEALRVNHGIDVLSIESVDTTDDINGVTALIYSCDIIVTISNTVAHLAGAMGKTVFLMLPYSTGRFWHWQENRTDSIWYTNVRIFRQETAGDWTPVLAAVRAHLEQWRCEH